ncbi:MAG: glycosyltransferase [Lachnospiraceae bacterium]|nr:glycosyltransferase [Lachnospiraceae bacterium]
MHSFNILFPVYNEENRLERGIRETASFLTHYLPEETFHLTIVDNASTDKTEEIAKKLAEEYPEVTYIRISEKGVGAAFRAGVAQNTSEIVGYMDVDLSTDIRHLLSVVSLFEDDPAIMMVNGSKQAKGARTIGRKWYRNLTSKGLTMVMKARLGMQQADAICGFKFFRKDFVEELIRQSDITENGWFFIIELLIRAERSGEEIVELPVRYVEEEGGHVHVVRQTLDYLSNIEKLRRRL